MLEEIDAVLRGEEPTPDSVDKLKYLNCVLKETLRVYPPAPILFRYSEKDDVLPSGYIIPKKTAIVISPYVLHLWEKYWPEPEKFDPMRWDNQDKYNPYTWIPFMMGDHNCIGQKFSMIEAKIILAKLWQKYTFKVLNPKVSKTLNITLIPHPPVTVALIDRIPRC